VREAELKNSDRFILQQDRAKAQKAKDVFKYSDDRDIQALEFPPKSPSLSWIEGVWRAKGSIEEILQRLPGAGRKHI